MEHARLKCISVVFSFCVHMAQDWTLAQWQHWSSEKLGEVEYWACANLSGTSI
jgi:hypothetical protein